MIFRSVSLKFWLFPLAWLLSEADEHLRDPEKGFKRIFIFRYPFSKSWILKIYGGLWSTCQDFFFCEFWIYFSIFKNQISQGSFKSFLKFGLEFLFISSFFILSYWEKSNFWLKILSGSFLLIFRKQKMTYLARF